MLEITETEIKKRLAFDNPWWETGAIAEEVKNWPRRAYFETFATLVEEKNVRRAVVLMGPRRVGKTVLIHQTILRLIDSGTPPQSILYVSLDTPTYIGISLEKLLGLFQEHGSIRQKKNLYVFFDEVQYLKEWEIHLKSLVDSFPNIRMVASGSAAAALKLKSRESGAGRFTDFLLPPLTFAEFLRFRGVEDQLIYIDEEGEDRIADESIPKLNKEFVDYLNFGGFPESVLIEPVRANFARFIGSDILDKVLLRDLPSLYGISDTQNLNRLFGTLAYNTGNEVSLEDLAGSSGISKNTLRKYLEYLEAAFLIRRVDRVDRNLRHFKRAVTFKVYLTNPCLRAALFGAVTTTDQAMGRLAETAVYSQLFNSDLAASAYYARWANGEVDLVVLNSRDQSAVGAIEIKWSDRVAKHPEELRTFVNFCKINKLADSETRVLTKNYHGIQSISGREVVFMPVSYLCYLIGKRTIEPFLESGLHPLWLDGEQYQPTPVPNSGV